MSNLSSIVDKERRFDNVHLFQLADKVSSSVEDKKFIPFDGNRPLKIIAIDQAEDLLLRFIENENEQVHNRTNGDNPNNNPITFASAVRDLQHNRDGDNNQPSLQHLHIGERIVHEITLYRESESFSYANDSYIIKDDSKRGSLAMIQFRNKLDRDRFAKLNQEFKKHHDQSTFNQRTDAASASQYFQFYGYLSQQQNMMQDYVRTATYQRAMLANLEDFKDKVVLDVGAGSGILSFFALQAGAKKVYAVEASSMAKHAQLLVQSNNLIGRIEVIAGKIEEVELPEPVDVIISEPMGYMLFNERMLETYLHAKKWLRSSETGRMFPSRGDLHVAPFSDAQLYIEQTNKANFWYSKDFHGVDLRALHSAATNEYFRQPVVDTFDIRICMAKTIRHVVDFQKSNETDLHCISIPLEYIACETGDIHGLAFWFDIAFVGSTQTIWLSTAPSQPLTHWYQVRCLLSTPLWVNKGEQINGSCVLRANKRQSYDVDMELFIKSRGTRSSNTLDLKNPYFRYTGQTVQAPPGTQEMSPSEQLWTTFDPYQQSANVVTTAQVPMSALAGQAIPIIQHHQQQPHQHDQQLHQPQQSHQQQTTVHQSIVNNAALMNSGMQSSQLAGTPMNDVGVNFNGIV